MQYLAQILWYLSFPATIIVSYYAVKLALKAFHKNEGVD